MTVQLDDHQFRFAQSDPRRPLLGIAGPGMGKTRTLVARIALLLEARRHGLLADGPIIALTFTRTATRELRERLLAALGPWDPAELDVRTFHAYGLSLLRGGWAAEYLGLERFSIATEGQQAHAAAVGVAGAGLTLTPAAALELIAALKIGQASRWRSPVALDAVRRGYDHELWRRNLIDVHDLVGRVVQILGASAQARADLARRRCHVVCDEFQDLSLYQAALVAHLAGPEGALSAVGDPCQCIYGGASPRFMLDLPRVYPHLRLRRLRRTYRLHRAVLDVANAVARYIVGGRGETHPQRDHGPLPLVHIARTPEEEAAWIAARLHLLHRSGALPRWADGVVLVRTRAQRAALLRRLRAAGVPARSGAASLADKPAVRAVMAWLTLLRDPDDAEALLVAVDAPPLGRRREVPATLRAGLERTGPWTVARLRREQPPGLAPSQLRALAGFLRCYEGLVAVVGASEPTATFDAIIERSGLGAWLVEAHAGAAADVDTLRTLATSEGDVGALALALGEEARGSGSDAVMVQTVHGYKGQEALGVFLAGLDEDVFPHASALASGPDGMQQEIRAYYVGVTRSLQYLALSSGCAPARYGRAGRPSPFLAMIPAACVRAVAA